MLKVEQAVEVTGEEVESDTAEDEEMYDTEEVVETVLPWATDGQVDGHTVMEEEDLDDGQMDQGEEEKTRKPTEDPTSPEEVILRVTSLDVRGRPENERKGIGVVAKGHGPRQEEQQGLLPNTDIRLVLQTLAESVQSIGARMDAVETPCGTPGRVQAPNPLSSVATAPFYFQQPSGSASSAFKGYAPGTCPATMATAAPPAYSLSQLYQSSFRLRLPRSGSGVSSKRRVVCAVRALPYRSS
ncbi:unnamed protein product [Boreogadus saida]